MSQVNQPGTAIRFAARPTWSLVLVVAIAGCGGSNNGPVTAERSGLRPADEQGGELASDGNGGTVGGDAVAAEGPAGRDIPPASDLDPIQAYQDPFIKRSDGELDEFENDPFTVPADATPEQLLAYIRRLDVRMPEGATDDIRKVDIIKTLEARIEAAEQILGASNVDEQLRYEAIEAKLYSLDMLTQFGGSTRAAALQQYATTLKDDKDPRVAWLSRSAALTSMLNALAAEETDDPAPVVTELKTLLADENANESIFWKAQGVAETFQRRGWVEEALEVLGLAGSRFQDSDNEDIAAAAAALIEQSRIVALQPELFGIMRGEEEAKARFLEQIDEIFSGEAPSISAYQIMMQFAQLLEYSGHVDVASNLLDKLKTTYANHEDKRFADHVAQSVERAMKRLSLIGQPFVIEGVTFDGEKFDWSTYRGKVVLVDFWASWCQPCLAEIPNIRENYEKYHAKGFDVVGVNLDNSPQDAAGYLASVDLPWTTVVAADPNLQGIEQDPNAVRYGVDAIPFIVLVDAEGKVLALHVRGEILGMKLAEIFGPAPDAGEAAVPAPDGDVPPISAGSDLPSTDAGDIPLPGESVPAPGGEPGAEPPATVPAPADDTQLHRPATVLFCSLNDTPANADSDQPATAESADAVELAGATSNPYAPDAELTTFELIDFLAEMEEKPRVIQSRPGFTDAVVEAADRLLASDASDKAKEIAALTKLDYLHKDACFGDEEADEALMEFVGQLKDSKREKIAERVAFLLLERRTIDVDDLGPEEIPVLLADLKTFFSGKKLAAEHLRIASGSVAAINRIQDDDEREKQFAEFGKLFAASDDKKLAAYGKKLAKTPAAAAAEIVGRNLELTGVTIDGTQFDWAKYRGQVVLVQFWATWCPACLREMPQVEAFAEQYGGQGVEVVGVMLDKDLGKVAEYFEKHNAAWTHLAGESCLDTAKEYGVRGIPQLLLVDGEGTIVAASHKVADLKENVATLLKKQAGG